MRKRIGFFHLLFFMLCFAGHAMAFAAATQPVSWQAYTLTHTDSASAIDKKTLLLALTLSPGKDTYLYGSESKEGLPTRLDVTAASLGAYPMKPLSQKEIVALLQNSGTPASIRIPPAILKKETSFASLILPGTKDTNPPVYAEPVTFWAELPAPESSLGGLAVQVTVSGLLCSATSCMPLDTSLEMSFATHEIASFPPAEKELWWDAWQKGESVFIPPVEHAGAVDVSPSAFTGGKSLIIVKEKKDDAVDDAVEDAVEALARQTAFFSTLEPTYFNPQLEVQYLGEALFFGLIAGLLLNLMPCVLPVVSLKFSALMAVTGMANKKEQAKAFREHCLIFAAGVLTWFLILALLLGGAGWAWGELFQSPVVLVCLGLLLFLLGLSLFDVFSLPIFDLKIASNTNPKIQAFASGLLATLLATPCSGPLLGGVLGWALRQPLYMLTLCVVSVGVGMAFPYVVLSFCPRLVHLLPRPGAWTLRLEQLLGFFLFGSVLYLGTLLPAEWIPPFLFNLLAIAFAAWLWGQIGHLAASRLQRGISRTLAIIVVLLAISWGAASIRPDGTWETFEPDEFAKLLGKEPMLLEFTADWCPSCKALEHTTLNRKRMAALRKNYGVRTIKVDITRDAEAGKELLKALGSVSIPVIALFPEGENATSPVVLRDLVTPDQLKKAAASAF